jgi:hypothetical protein
MGKKIRYRAIKLFRGRITERFEIDVPNSIVEQ